MKKITIFASGAGSNTQAIIDHFRHSTTVKVAMICCNNPRAGVIDIAGKASIPLVMIRKDAFYHSNEYLVMLQENRIDLIVLAGFLWKLPENIVQAFPEKIINIHPALLPKFGGKGMYGLYVHQAVLDKEEKESGITIHYVNENYDEGKVILQKSCKIAADDTPDKLAQKIHQLEHTWYPRVIEQLLQNS